MSTVSDSRAFAENDADGNAKLDFEEFLACAREGKELAGPHIAPPPLR